MMRRHFVVSSLVPWLLSLFAREAGKTVNADTDNSRRLVVPAGRYAFVRQRRQERQRVQWKPTAWADLKIRDIVHVIDFGATGEMTLHPVGRVDALPDMAKPGMPIVFGPLSTAELLFND